ncbi:MAG TPA: 3'-5' exonuclease [Verrucomicrobiae bacterium]|jgi:superfamily I DNA/RNA helicase|nr:3'-5' exonuclease [Verrucomicrobiae bacterium]
MSAPCIALTGAAGAGKTTALLERVTAARLPGRTLLLLAPSTGAVDVLRERLGAADDVRTSTFGDFAVWLLGEFEPARAPLAHARIIDDVAAEARFFELAEPLLSLAWPEFADGSFDPEVPGLRMPRRFLEAAFRLIRKLRDAQISPEAFLQTAQIGATSFYAKPPNLASPDLLYYTKDAYRDSLDADGEELARQFRHETHLAKILAKLYRGYVDAQARHGLLTPRDAVAEATALLAGDPAFAANLRERFAAAFVDEAQDLTMGEIALLQSFFGSELADVTLAGDPDGATATFRGARPDRAFAAATERIVLDRRQRTGAALETHRAESQIAEARFVADWVARHLRAGTPARQIAVLFRSVRAVRIYEEALLARNVPVQIAGDANLYEDPRALDALALLWNLHDPFRHDFLLRTLSAPAMALSDASLITLCGEPPDAQAMLFIDDEVPDAQRSSRFDPKRGLRLGWNLLRGDADVNLSPIARERIETFRRLRASWLEAQTRLALPDLARKIWSEGLAALGSPDTARAIGQSIVLGRLLGRLDDLARREPNASLGDFLADAELHARSDLESCDDIVDADTVLLASVGAVRGREFSHVAIPNARAGAFPRWYVPDSFLYSPSLGMIAKDNVGEASASRTAKFSYYLYKFKTRERYNEEERRAFVYARRRARESTLVTAFGKATRGLTAPEFLEELGSSK